MTATAIVMAKMSIAASIGLTSVALDAASAVANTTIRTSPMTTACQEMARRPPSRSRRDTSTGLRFVVRLLDWPIPRGSGVQVPRGNQAKERNLRSRRLLVTTKTEEKAMAAPAIIGLSSPATASGIAATL